MRLPKNRAPGEMELGPTGVQRLGQTQRIQRLLEPPVGAETLRLCDQGSRQRLQSADPLLRAKRSNLLGLPGRVIGSAVLQQRLALEPERLQSSFEGVVVESPSPLPERRRFHGLHGRRFAAGRGRTEADHTAIAGCRA
jgi:hypothetical protein